MKYYQHHIGDFDKATRHLTRIERSIYRDLIELYYDTEQPLSRDFEALCRKIIARSDEERTAVQQTLNEFFTETEQGWFHDRCDAEIDRYHNNSSQKAAAGRASAEKRAAKKHQPLDDQSTVEQQTFNTRSTDEQLTINHEPLTINQDKEKKAKSPSAPSLFRDQALGILDYLNLKADKAFQPVDSHLDKIIALLKAGYLVDDMRRVIDNKCAQWKGDAKCDDWLRPKTLFSKENFANYVGERRALGSSIQIKPDAHQTPDGFSHLGKAGRATALAAQRFLQETADEIE